jgi:uncharacterized protein
MGQFDGQFDEPSSGKPASGTLGQFVLGAMMAGIGGYMITTNVTVSTGFWYIGGYNAFGTLLVTLVLGIGILFFNGKSVLGWLFSVGSALAMLIGIILNMQVYFQPTSLFTTVLMLTLLVGGLGMMARVLRS